MDTAETPAPTKQLYALPVLEISRKAQLQNGLRQGDFMRYRQYLTRRLTRLRKALKMNHSRRHFQKIVFAEDRVTDSRHLLLPLMYAERAWAYAMDLKREEDGRMKFHMHRRLKKALMYSAMLLRLCKATADERTCIEAEAYHDWMSGTVAFERSNWEEALSHFRTTRTVYDKLGRISTDPETVEMYSQRVEELDPIVRFCRYNISRSGGAEGNDEELLAMTDDGQGDALLRAKLDAAIEQTLKKQADAMEQVTWRGAPLPVKNDKVRVCIIEARELGKKTLDESTDKRLAHFDKMFMVLNDALSHIRADLLALMNEKPAGHEVREQVLGQLTAFITHELLLATVRRNRALVDDLKTRMEVQASTQPSNKNKYAAGKPVSPEDIATVYERLVQNMQEFAALPGFERDADEARAVMVGTTVYKGLRCCFMAQSYNAADKWAQAVALFNRAQDYAAEAAGQAKGMTATPTVVELADITALQTAATAGVTSSRALGVLHSAQSSDRVGERLEALAVSQVRVQPSILDRLDRCVTEASGSPHVIDFPPSLDPIPVKPVLFDLAFDSVDFPDLSHRKRGKKGLFGIFG